jgi:Na+/citrate or Na+/malate symporter
MNLSQAPSPLRYFYSMSAILMLVLTLIGFHHFYLLGESYPGRPITPPIRGLVITHGIAMTAWCILMIIQPMLIATRSYAVHKALGRTGAALAAILVVLGLMVATRSAAVTPPDFAYGALSPKQFMAVPYIGILMFGLYVAIGVWHRKQANLHKPMMFLATLAVLAAPLDRIDAVRNIFANTIFYTIWGPFFSALLIGSILFIVRYSLTKSFDRYFALGLAGLFLAFGVMMQIAITSAWDNFASALIR